MRNTRRASTWGALLLVLLCIPAFTQIRVAENSRYFKQDDKNVILFGSGVWTIIPDTTIDIEEHNTWYSEAGANVNRATLYAFFNSVADGEGLGPWARTGPGLANDGKPKFDLTQSNEAFWERAYAYFNSCLNHDTYVWLQIFDEPYLEQGRDRWFLNPFNPDNNINALPGMPGGDTSGEEAFYDPDNAPLMAIQDALVSRLIGATSPHRRIIIYEIGNEVHADSVTRKSAAWQQHWIEFFRAWEHEHGESLLLTNDTRRSLFVQGAPHFQAVNHHAFHDLPVRGVPPLDLARNIASLVQRDFDDFHRPIVNSRPCSDPDRTNYPDIVSEDEGRNLFWSYFMSGGQIIGFRTTNESWKGGLATERILKSLRSLIQNAWSPDMVPRPDLVGGPVLCLANKWNYFVYFPEGGEATLDRSGTGLPLTMRWYNPREGEWGQELPIPYGSAVPLNSPDEKDWVAVVEMGG